MIKFKDKKIKSKAIRIFFSFIIAVYFVSTIRDSYPDLPIEIEALIGVLVFLLVNTAAKFIPIEEILGKVI